MSWTTETRRFNRKGGPSGPPFFIPKFCQPVLHQLRCLKQDEQDEGDEGDEAAVTPRKGLEALNVYRTSAQPGEKVREDLNIYNV